MEVSYKFRIYPNKEQEQLIQKTFGCVRYVYNYFYKITGLYNTGSVLPQAAKGIYTYKITNNRVGRDTPEPIRLVRVCKTQLRRYAR